MKKSLNILMVLFTQKYEGTYYRAFPWASYLVSQGHRVTLLCTSKHSRFRTTVSDENGVRIIETPAFMTGGKLMPRLTAMNSWGPLDIAARYSELKNSDYDIIHVFEHHMHVSLPVYLAGRKNIPVLIADWCDHYGPGGFRENASSSRYYPLYRQLGKPVQHVLDFIEGDLRRRADAVTVISTYLRQRALDCGVPADKIHLIPGSSETDQIRVQSKEEARKEKGLDPDLNYVLFFGAGQFDLDFSLEAFKRVQRDFPQSRFIVVGKEDPDVTRKAAELGVTRKTIQTGWIDDDGLSDWLACADVCLLPMKDTPINHARWPNKIGFYMAAGRPTVATGVNDVGELIETGDIGLVSRPDPQDFAEKIEYLFAHRRLAEDMGQRARRIAEKEFALPVQGAELEKLYLNLAGVAYAA